MAGLFDEPRHEGGGGHGLAGVLSGKILGLPAPLVLLLGAAAVWIYESRKTSTASTSSVVTPGATGSLTPQQYAQEYAAAGGTATATQAWYNDNASPYGGSTATATTPEAAPVLNTISPATGPATGGGTAIISGSNFAGTTAVSFGGVPASFSVSNTGTIFATIPAAKSTGNAGGTQTVQVTVVNPIGSTTGLDFTYTASTPATGATHAPVHTTPGPAPSSAPPSTPAKTPKTPTGTSGSGVVYGPGGATAWGYVGIATGNAAASARAGGQTLYFSPARGVFEPVTSTLLPNTELFLKA